LQTNFSTRDDALAWSSIEKSLLVPLKPNECPSSLLIPVRE
jgi:hypothetical protein